MAKLSFYGAAGTVTGSRHLLEFDNQKLLIDCGLFQGKKENRLKNWEPFPVAPGEIDKVLLTHAHIDHAGYLPRFFKHGFSGPIHCTHSTYDLAQVLLRDSAHIHEEDARWANKKGYSKHKPALPLYTVEDAENTLSLFSPLYYGDALQIDEFSRAKYRDAGHILGSSFIDFKTTRNGSSRKIIFSGDLGRPDLPILRDPAQAFNADYLVLESTYGNRLHSEKNPHEELIRVINDSVNRGGVLVIPAFAVGRTQTLLYLIRELEDEGKIPAIPVYVDSPMAIDATKIFRKNIADQDLTSRVKTLSGKKIFTPQYLNVCRSREQSISINEQKGPAIIISSSGMATAGRILHHLKQRLPQKENTILFIGYQAEGSRGRAILDKNESVKIHGQHIAVKAHVEKISGYSGHADYNEILAWLMGFNKAPEKTFLVHGEPDAANSLAEKIKETFGWEVIIPKFGDSFEIDL